MSENLRSDDELLSSHLDSELSDEESALLDARLTSEPALRARLTTMRSARDLTGSPVASLTSSDTDRMIAAAMAARGTSPDVTDLVAARSRRRVWPSRVAGVAAAAFALALAVPALRAIDNGGDSDTAGVDDQVDEAFAGDSPETAADIATEAAALGEDPAGLVPDDLADLGLFADHAGFDPLADDLGDFATTTALAIDVSDDWANYRITLDPAPATTTTVAGSDDGTESIGPAGLLSEAYNRFDTLTTAQCATIVEVIVDHFTGETVVAADYASATVDGAAVTVGAFVHLDGRAELLVIDQATCNIRSAPLD